MKNTYFDLIDQSYYFPQDGFDVEDGYLNFNGISLKYLIDKYGTPLRIMYLPKIADQIKRVRNLFRRAIKKNKYGGEYHNCYCTKCNHFAPVIKKAIKQGVNLETSSSYDIDLIMQLMKEEKVDTNLIVVHNGYKTDAYLDKILKLQSLGFKNSVIVLDSINEFMKMHYLNEDKSYLFSENPKEAMVSIEYRNYELNNLENTIDKITSAYSKLELEIPLVLMLESPKPPAPPNYVN